MAAVDVDRDRVANQRIRQVFEYLKALNDHRNPAIRQVQEQPWLLWLDNLPMHSAIDLPPRTINGGDMEAGDRSVDYVLRVRRPVLTQPPSPIPELREWLQGGWEDPERPAAHIESRNERSESGDAIAIRFQDEPQRVAAFDLWQAKRAEWSEAEIPVRKAMRVFEKLYALFGRLERDSELYDLVIGDGILSWRRDDGSIYHPLLIQRVQLVFDPQVPQFLVIDSDSPGEFCTSLFQAIEGVDAKALHARRTEYQEGGYHPLTVEVNAFLQGLANQISSRGRFIGPIRPGQGGEPEIGRAPILFLRSRSKGFGTAIETILDNIGERSDFPEALKNIVGIESVQPSAHEYDQSTAARDALAQDILFGKDANPEQIRIARQLDRHGSVLVQGPPGTGKSHTIANLIGHLLANGKSVLVTSHTTKALRVLRGHVVESLRPLCVSVLDSDLDSREELKAAVQAIGSRLSDSDADQLEQEARVLARRRDELFARLNDLQTDALKARTAEYREILIAGTAYLPSDAARTVAEGRGRHDWLPSPIAAGEPLPLTDDEVVEVYATNQLVSLDDERYADEPLPLLQQLMTPDQFEQSLNEAARLAAEGQCDLSYWRGKQLDNQHIGQLSRLAGDFRQAVAEIAGFREWQLAAVDAGRRGKGFRDPWEHLVGKIEEVTVLDGNARLHNVRLSPSVRDWSYPLAQKLTACEIREHLSRGGNLNWWILSLRRNWKTRLNNWRVTGRAPTSVDEITAIQQVLEIRIARDELCLLWDGLVLPFGGPGTTELGEAPEQNAAQFIDCIRSALAWWDTRLQRLIDQLTESGFDWKRFVSELPPDLSRFGGILQLVRAIETRLIAILEATANHLRSIEVTKRMCQPLSSLANYRRPEVVGLREAIRNGDVDAYCISFGRCVAADGRRKSALRRRELLAAFDRRRAASSAAPSWATCIRQRSGVHGCASPPGDPSKAWEWRQLSDELDRRAELDLDELGAAIEQVKRGIATTTNELIDRRAWAFQVRKITLPQRQALAGWLGAVQKIGKGFGKRAATLRRFAQEKMEECRTAVPVWIMPLARVAESFDCSKPRFDVVIIDEASQCDMMALIAALPARQVVVVGDDKQVSPLAVGQKLEIVDELIRLHLQGIPNAELYDGRQSIYELAQQAFSAKTPLLEHFRCVPDIIAFSQYLSYGGELKPLREAASSPLHPPVVPYRVDGRFESRSKTNVAECWAVASLLAAAIEQDEYAGKTFGVISLVGDKQAIEIERLLLRHLSPQEYQRRRIICGNAAQFQGDERDVVFLSVVHAAEDGPLALSTLSQTQQRFNVAASRARDQMWVVYSLDPGIDLKPGDLRRRLIEHALDPQAMRRAFETTSARTESPFEREVLQRLMARGYCVRPQWWVGRYRIDLVVEGGGKRLAVECDGDRYHTIENLAEDMERQAILERLGWRFVRLRGSEFFRDRDATMEKVFERLAALEIRPESDTTGNDGPIRSESLEVLKRRAAAVREEWRERDSNERIDDDDDVDGVSDSNGSLAGARESTLHDTAHQGRPSAAPVVILERGAQSGDGELGSSTSSWDRVVAAESRIEIWRMPRGDFHRYKRNILPPTEIDVQEINREYVAAVRQAISEGKEVPDEILREAGITRANGS